MDKSIVSEALGRLRKEMRGRTGKKLVGGVGPTVTIEIAHKPDVATPTEEPPEAEKEGGAADLSSIVSKAIRGGKK